MKYISSDTNVWIDFNTIAKLELPFRLPYTYIMFKEALQDELLSPPEMIDELIGLGLQGVDITTEEFYYAIELADAYSKLSTYDRVALAIAKKREIELLTGDGPLRKAAIKEKVNVVGTIGLLDRLYEGKYIRKSEYVRCLKSLLKHSERRLPEEEINMRINNVKEDDL